MALALRRAAANRSRCAAAQQRIGSRWIQHARGGDASYLLEVREKADGYQWRGVWVRDVVGREEKLSRASSENPSRIF